MSDKLRKEKKKQFHPTVTFLLIISGCLKLITQGCADIQFVLSTSGKNVSKLFYRYHMIFIKARRRYSSTLRYCSLFFLVL